MRALGYDVERYKLIAFVLSAGIAGIAGGVFSISHGFVSLQEVDWTTSGKVVLMTVLGGIGTLWGGPIGAAVIVLLEDYLASAGFEGIGIVTGRDLHRRAFCCSARASGAARAALIDRARVRMTKRSGS